MTPDALRTLYDYHYWELHHVWNDCVMQLSDAQFRQDSGYSHGSIHAEVVHLMNGEWLWLARARGQSPQGDLTPADYPDRAGIRTKWDHIETEMRGFVATMNTDTLEAAVHYTLPQGAQVENHVWKILFHILNHGTIHRAEIMAISHQIGGPSFDLSFMQWLMRRGN